MVHLYLTFFFYMHATDAHGHIQCACTCSKSSVKVWYWNHVQRYHSHNAGGLLENEKKNWSLETRLQTLHTLEHSNAVNYFYFFFNYFLHVHHKDTKQHISEINFACLITFAVLHFFSFQEFSPRTVHRQQRLCWGFPKHRITICRRQVCGLGTICAFGICVRQIRISDFLY